MLGLNSGSSGLMDNVSGRREFGAIRIFERVVDTDGRTINIDNIATVSVGVIPRRLWRWVVWALAVVPAGAGVSDLLRAVNMISEGYGSHAWSQLGSSVLFFAIAAGLYFLGRRFSNINVLIIGASDGSRSVFRSKNLAYIEEVKAFLTKKINEHDLTAKLAADFKAAQSAPIVNNNYFGGTHVENNGLIVAGDGNQIAHDSPGAMVGNGNIKLNGSGNRIGTHETSYALNGAAGVQIGTGNVSAGNHTAFAKIDFSQVLPQVGELQRHYAQSDNMRHIEQRLAEMERLMRAGAVLPEQKSRVRELAKDLGGFFQTYPALVQFFGHIGTLAGL